MSWGCDEQSPFYTPISPSVPPPLSPHPLFNTPWRVGCVCVCINVPEHCHCYVLCVVYFHVCLNFACCCICMWESVWLCVCSQYFCVFLSINTGFGGLVGSNISLLMWDIIGELILMMIFIAAIDTSLLNTQGKILDIYYVTFMVCRSCKMTPKTSFSTITWGDLYVFTVMLLSFGGTCWQKPLTTWILGSTDGGKSGNMIYRRQNSSIQSYFWNVLSHTWSSRDYMKII